MATPCVIVGTVVGAERCPIESVAVTMNGFGVFGISGTLIEYAVAVPTSVS